MRFLPLLLLFLQETPEDHFGFKMGADRKLARYDQVVAYIQKLGVPVVELGKTTQKHPFVMAVFGSETDRAREIAKKLAGGRLSEDEARRLAREGKPIIMITCNLHSTEIGSSQTAVEIAAWLAKNPPKEAIVLLVPSLNPDGQMMITDWYNKYVGTEFEGGPMPWLYHPYAGHDNNRDWFAMNLPETRHLSEVYYKSWRPQVIVDHHQMGSTGARMFIPPYEGPLGSNYHPLISRWINYLGTSMARRLEGAGKTGVTHQKTFTAHWIGGSVRTPWWTNQVGLLTETASCRIATPVFLDANEAKDKEMRVVSPTPWRGGWWRLRDIVDYQLIATIDLIETVANHREEILLHSWQMARDQIAAGGDRIYFIPDAQYDPSAAQRLLWILEHFDVETKRVEGGVVVPLAQPKSALLRELMEPQRYSGTSKPYDVAAWTLPLQMGVDVSTQVEVTAAPEGGDTGSYGDLNRTLRSGKTVVRDGWTLRAPRVGLYKPWNPSMDEGWTRLVLEQFDFDFRNLDNAAIQAGSLRKDFDCVILPDVSPQILMDGRSKRAEKFPWDLPKEYQGGIEKKGLEALKKFVEEGGTLLAFDSACDFAIEHWPVPAKNVLKGMTKPEDEEEDKPDAKFACPGSILRCEIDTSHFLGTGMPKEAVLFFADSPAFETSLPPNGIDRAVVARYPEKGEILASGYLTGGDLLKGRAALVEVTIGKGRIVLFGFRVQHRAQTWGTYKLLFNAIHLSAAEKK